MNNGTRKMVWKLKAISASVENPYLVPGILVMLTVIGNYSSRGSEILLVTLCTPRHLLGADTYMQAKHV